MATPSSPVSCKTVSAVLRGIRERGIDVEELTRGLPVAVATLEDPRETIDWSVMVEILARTQSLCGGPAGIRDLGRLLNERRVLGPLHRFFAFTGSPRQLYRLLVRFHGPASFLGTSSSIEADPDGEIRVTIGIDPRLEGSMPFFHLIEGALETAPRALGLGDSIVQASITSHQAKYTILPPPSPSLLSRLARVREMFRGSRSAIDELAEHHERLKQSYDDLNQAHRQILAQEQRYRRLAESARDMIAEWDARGRCVYVSPNVEALLGYAQDHFLAADHLALLHPDDREGVREALGEREDSGSPGHATFRVRHRNGAWRWFESSSNPVQTPEGEPTTVTISREVTERVELEQQLRHAQKLEAVGRLAGGVAHDFNNLLTIITGCSEALRNRLDGGVDEPELREAAEQIQHAASRAAALTEQLLAFSRRQVARRRVVSLNEVVTAAHRMLQRVIGEDIELVTRLAPRLGTVRADPSQLEQMILNLAVNARDAMPDGGRLLLETAEVALGVGEARALDVAPGPYVRLRVADSGCGIDPGIQSKIFEPFFTTKAAGTGTGLGLSTVYGMVRQNGGQVSVASNGSQGATFDIHLPRSSEPATAPEAPPAQDDPALGSATVLVVEDEDSVRRIEEKMLESYGYRVLTARDASEALRIAGEHGGGIDLLLTDVVMPGASGPQLAEALLRLYPGLRVLFVSGYVGGETPAGGLLDPEANLLAKPFSAQTLIGKVREALAARQPSADA